MTHDKKIILAVFITLIVLAINCKIIFSSLNTDFIGIVVSLSLFIIGGRKTTFKINYFLFVLIIILEFVSYRLHTQSVHFLAILLFICLVFHYLTGKFSYVAFISILLFSTLFSTFFSHLTSEIKQGLCSIVFLTLKSFMKIDEIEGVNFYINNAKITIDTACMGLSMFKSGLLTGAILMTLEEKKQKQYYGIFQILTFCFLIIVLNIISNYFRITALILFNCTQENIWHHGIGLICFIIYQIIPMFFIIKYLKPKFKNLDLVKINSKKTILIVVFILLLITSLKITNTNNETFYDELCSKYNTKKGVWVNNEVFKIQTNSKLIYIKTPSHNPLVCWTGDGYKITESKKIYRNNEEIWLNKMEKENIHYNSYYWYECGNKKYTSFITVMFIKFLYNQPIFLINETTKQIK